MENGPQQDKELTVKVYSPESSLQDPRRFLSEMKSDLLRGRELAWQLFLRDLKAQYRQSILGYVWALIPPLVTSGTFIFLNSQNVIEVGETPVAYAAYVLIGTLLWQNFVDAVNAPLHKVTLNKPLLTKLNFPREAVVLAALGEVIFNFLIRLVILVPVFIYFKLPLTTSLLLFPVGYAGLLLFGITLGVLLSPLSLLYNDVARGLTLVTGFWFFITPVMYPPPTSGFAAILTELNPVTPLISTARDLLINEPALQLEAFGLVSAVSAALLAVGWVIYRVSFPHVIARLGM